MDEDLADHDRVDDEADDAPLAFAFGAEQDVMKEDPLDQFGPGVILRAPLSWPSLCSAGSLFLRF